MGMLLSIMWSFLLSVAFTSVDVRSDATVVEDSVAGNRASVPKLQDCDSQECPPAPLFPTRMLVWSRMSREEAPVLPALSLLRVGTSESRAASVAFGFPVRSVPLVGAGEFRCALL